MKKNILQGMLSKFFQTFDSRPNALNQQTDNPLDPACNKDLHSWENYLKNAPKKGKKILEKYFSTLLFGNDEPFFQWEFLNSFNLTIRKTLLISVISRWSWEQVQSYLQQQMNSGIIYTPNEWRWILEYIPQAAEFSIPWSEFTPEEWVDLLEKHVQFSVHCSCFDKFSPVQWGNLLAAHPDLEKYGVCFNKFSEKNWEELCCLNDSFLLHKENWCLRDELRPAFALRRYIVDEKNFLIGVATAASLCKGNEKTYQIKGLDTKTHVPRTETIDNEEIERVLIPFCKFQEAIFIFLSSGKTEGIMPEYQENLAHEFPVHNRKELEILLAIGQPGPLIYWNEYKENHPCRLAAAAAVARQTRGILLYKEQQEQALLLLAGCSQEEAVDLRAKHRNLSVRAHLLQLIAAHNGISLSEAEKLYRDWNYYMEANISHVQAAKMAYKIYLQAWKHLQTKNSMYRLSD